MVSPKAARRRLETAKRYLSAGLSMLPVLPGGRKQPARAWECLQCKLPEVTSLYRWFYINRDEEYGIGVITGKISGNLEAIDFDSIELFEPWAARIKEKQADLIPKLVLVQTPRPGMHVYFRCSKIEGNQKLALGLRPHAHGKSGIKALIETRGEGGFVLAPGSPGSCHQTGKKYRVVSDRPITDITTISAEERDLLLETARSFDELPAKSKKAPRNRAPICRQEKAVDCSTPWADFNARADWADILEPHGWQYDRTDSRGEHWIRPGKAHDAGPSAHILPASDQYRYDRMFVFSSNAHPLEPTETGEAGYTKFDVYAKLNHAGDVRAAARALSSQGYGVSKRIGKKRPGSGVFNRQASRRPKRRK